MTFERLTIGIAKNETDLIRALDRRSTFLDHLGRFHYPLQSLGNAPRVRFQFGSEGGTT